MKWTYLFVGLILCACSTPKQTETVVDFSYPFQDPSLSAQERAEDIVGRLTMDEKVLQLFNNAPAIERLGIPAYNWWNEALHGVARAGKATVFPQAIGLAATFNESLVHEMATIISDEARAKHHHFANNGVRSIYTGLTFWSPNINIFRDPRWGRGQETYGEDPYLTGRMAVNFIKGLQGDNPNYLKTIATAKHYAVHSGPEYTRHSDNFFVNDRDLYETYLPAFEMAVREANVRSVMCAYNRFRDQPCCGSDLLLENILRDNFGFEGYVVTDCGAVSDFYQEGKHNVVGRPSQAWGWALAAGTDLNCEESKAFLEDNYEEALEMGMLNAMDIDRALIRLFKARVQLGLFDHEELVPYAQTSIDIVGQEKHLKIAEELARQSFVLLKNDKALPIAEGQKIALIGPNANNIDVLLGNYNGQPVQPTTPLEGLKDRFGSENILQAVGSPLVPDVYGNKEVIPSEVLFHRDGDQLKPGLRADYFEGLDMETKPSISRIDSHIDFLWEQNPITSKLEGSFAVEWSGVLKPKVSGEYQFDMFILYGAYEIRIDGALVEDRFISLKAGQSYDLNVVFKIEPFWWGNTISPDVHLRWVDRKVEYQKQAVALAAQSDVIVFCGGISPRLEGEEMKLDIDGFAHGDRTHIDLPEVQRNLLKELKKLGKPVVMINFSGSAISLNWEDENLDAIVQAFYPGEATGSALAALLAGDYSPSGRLPITFYASVDDLPPFVEYAMKNRTYKYYEGEVLYPFGHGLSYTAFDYTNPSIPKETEIGEDLEVSITVTNTGDKQGSEVVQLYARVSEARVPTPKWSLKKFEHVHLAPGASMTVRFVLNAKEISYIDENYERVLSPGSYGIYVGGSQPEKLSDFSTIKLTGQKLAFTK